MSIDHLYKEITCNKCNNVLFNVKKYNGAGGSGTYIKLICSKCGEIIEYDFDNPYYEG